MGCATIFGLNNRVDNARVSILDTSLDDKGEKTKCLIVTSQIGTDCTIDDRIKASPKLLLQRLNAPKLCYMIWL